MEPVAYALTADLTYAARTDIGRVRTNNEDNFLALPDIGLFIVCDGMGGHQAGEVASRQACETLQREVTTALTRPDAPLSTFAQSGSLADAHVLRHILEQGIATAGHEIFTQASRDLSKSGMGTTCTAVWLIGHGKAILGHVGDSRLYVLRAGEVIQLSDDHTYVDELVKRGALTAEEARHHPNSNILTRGLGVQTQVDVDTLLFDVDPEDTLLLCSDGLYNEVASDNTIHTLLKDSTPLDDGIRTLVAHAVHEGGHDNITAIAIRLPKNGSRFTEHTSSVGAHQRITLLRGVPMLAQLNYQELAKILGYTHHHRAEAGATIAAATPLSDTLYVVLTGEVLQSAASDGSASSLPALHAGAFVGQTNVLYDAPLDVTLTARTDTEYLTLQGNHVATLIQREPTIATKLLWGLSAALGQTTT